MRLEAAVIRSAAALAVLLNAAAFGQSLGVIPSQMLTVTGNAGHVSVPDSPDLVPSTGYTVEAWFYFDPAAPGGPNSPTILRKPEQDPSYLLRTSNASGGSLQFYGNVGGNYTSMSGPTTPILSWHHLAGTHDGATMKMFLDGVLVASQPLVGPPGFLAGPLKIGRGHPAGEVWKGSLDGVRIWSFARSAAQIAAESRLRLTSAPGLVAAWYFDGDFMDSVGSHHPTTTSQVALSTSTSPIQVASLVAPVAIGLGDVLAFSALCTKPMTPYIFDFSLSGTSPGLPLPMPLIGTIPLNEPWIYDTYGAALPPEWFANFFGLTDAAGAATPMMVVPNWPALVGLQITGAYALFDPSAPYGVAAISNARTVTVYPAAPVVTSVTPAVVGANGGALLTVVGSGFAAGAGVLIGGATATSVTVLNGSTLTCIAPARPAGVYSLTVTLPTTQSSTLPAAVTYVPPIIIISVNPAAPTPGTPVLISGSGFAPGIVLTVGGSPTPIIFQTSSAISFLAPANVSCGAVVALTDPLSGLSVSQGWNVAPSITSVASGAGPASGGSVFNLFGSGFAVGSTVTVGGAAAGIINMSSTAAACVAPPGTAGTAPIVITTPSGCSGTAVFTYF